MLGSTLLMEMPSISRDPMAVMKEARLLNARPAPGFSKPRYPGQNVLRTRKENMENGIPVDETVWQAILDLPDAPNSTSGSWL